MRLFIALPLPEGWRSPLSAAAQALRARSPRCTPTRRENFHLTLAFLGEQPSPGPARRAMEEVGGPPLTLTTGEPGAFRQGEEELWWLGLEPSPRLEELHRQLRAALAAQGLPVEARPFRPHLTLARRVEPRRGTAAALAPLLPPMTGRVEELVLFQSHRPGGRLTYTPLFRRPLAP